MADIFKSLGEVAKSVRINTAKIGCQNDEIIALLTELVVVNGGIWPTTTTTTTTTTTSTTTTTTTAP